MTVATPFLDLLRTLLDQLSEIARDTTGVNHQVMNKTELSVLMRSEDTNEDVKREAIYVLTIFIFISIFNSSSIKRHWAFD